MGLCFGFGILIHLTALSRLYRVHNPFQRLTFWGFPLLILNSVVVGMIFDVTAGATSVIMAGVPTFCLFHAAAAISEALLHEIDPVNTVRAWIKRVAGLIRS